MTYNCNNFNILKLRNVSPKFRSDLPPANIMRNDMAEEMPDDAHTAQADDVADFVEEICKNNNPQFIGIEVEVESVKLKPEYADNITLPFEFMWKTKEDGSLRNHGAEYVSRLGLTMDLLETSTNCLEEYIKTAIDGEAEANARTGLHVHFDVGNKSLYEIANILFLYAIFEPIFFHVSGGRNENIFCVPWYSNKKNLGEVISSLVTVTKNGNYERLWRWRNYSKYCALNISTISTYGTLEFRMHRGTYSQHAINRWVKTINALFRYAKQTKIEDNFAKYRLDRKNWKYEEALFRIFSEYILEILPIRDRLIDQCKESTLATYKGFVDFESLDVSAYKDKRINKLNQDFNMRFNMEDLVVENGGNIGVGINEPDDDDRNFFEEERERDHDDFDEEPEGRR